MKILILSCNTGGGHNSVALAIRETYLEHGQTADIVDALLFLPKGWSKLSSDVHSYIYINKPEVFRQGYNHAELHRKQFSKGHSVRNLLDLVAAKLGKYIIENQYDQVLCCHVFAGLMLTDAVRRYSLSVVSGIVETDYTVTPGAEKCLLDWHFVPTEKQKEELSRFGVPSEMIAVTGIPTRTQFMICREQKDVREQFGFDTSPKNILIACGSMGCGPIEQILERLALRQSEDDSFTVSIVCGTNKKLREQLTQKYVDCPGIYIFGKVQRMSEMLDAADVYITKPGGISVTEAAQKRLPMVLINAVGGCEKHNMDFFVESGGAVTADDAAGLADTAVQICKDEALRRKMAEAVEEVFSENNRDRIYSLLMNTGSRSHLEGKHSSMSTIHRCGK